MNDQWRQRAACRDRDPELWFPKFGTTRERVLEAKSICFGCPVRVTCLEYSQTQQIPFGIWGGYSAKQRWRMRRGEPPSEYMPKWATSIFYQERAAAVRAFQRAQQTSVKQTARDLGVDRRTLYRAWEHWGLGKPIHGGGRHKLYSRGRNVS